MRLIVAATLSLACHAALAASCLLPSASDFNGAWRIGKVIGASNGGVSDSNPKAMLGKIVNWSDTDVTLPSGECHFRHPEVVLMSNRVLETSIWGGQIAQELDLSKKDINLAFGWDKTPVFQDESGCANPVLIGHDHLVLAFESGWIYRLDRIER